MAKSKFTEREKLNAFLENEVLGRNVVVLVLSGSFNPIHRMHVQMLVAARDWLFANPSYVAERYCAGESVAVLGVLAPSSNGYVQGKLGKDFISLQHRTEMARQAVSDLNWVITWSEGIANATRCASSIISFLAGQRRDLEFHATLVCGADHAVRARMWRSPALTIQRPGEDAQKLLERLSEDDCVKHRDFRLIEDSRIGSHSSTQLRGLLRRPSDEAWQAAYEITFPSVVHYIEAHSLLPEERNQ